MLSLQALLKKFDSICLINSLHLLKIHKKVLLEPCLLWAALSACLHSRGAYPSDHLCGTSLDSLKQVNLLPLLRTTYLDAALQVRSHKSSVRIPSLALLGMLLLLQPKI